MSRPHRALLRVQDCQIDWVLFPGWETVSARLFPASIIIIIIILKNNNNTATCTRGSRYLCSASMLYYCMTVCQPLTARTDDHTHFLIFYSIFKLPWDYIYRGLNNNNNNNKIIIIIRGFWQRSWEQLSVLADICSNTALQRYLAAWELCWGEPPGNKK